MRFDRRGYIGFFVLSVLIVAIWYLLGSMYILAMFPLSVFLLLFHRKPSRKVQEEYDSIIAPCDGRVTDIETKDGYTELSVYLGLTDVHVYYAPVQSKVNRIERISGGHKPAFIKQSEKNERLMYSFDNGVEILVITGFLARRIKPYVRSGLVDKGDELGIISFGSRLNIKVPKNEFENLCVEEGDRIQARDTVMFY